MDLLDLACKVQFKISIALNRVLWVLRVVVVDRHGAVNVQVDCEWFAEDVLADQLLGVAVDGIVLGRVDER